MQTELARDSFMAQSLFDQLLNGLIALLHHSLSLLLLPFAVWSKVTKQERRFVCVVSQEMNGFECPTVCLENTFYHVCEITHNMESVGTLNGLWGPHCGSTSKFASTITANQLNASMLFQPGCKGRGLTVGKQLNWLARFKIDEDRAIASSPAIGPLIHTQHVWGRFHWRRHATDDSQKRHTRTWEAKKGAQSSSGFPSQCKADFR